MKTEETQVIAFRATSGLVRQIDRWRGSQDDVPGRAEAIRRLVTRALGKGRLEGNSDEHAD